MDKYPGMHILAGIQADHRESLLENFDNRYEGKFYEELQKLAGQVINDEFEKRFIFLTGNPGSGKTHFLVGLFRSKAMQDQGVIGAAHALYLPFNVLITEIISSFKEVSSTRVALSKYLSVKYFFIDDISRGERTIDPEKIEGQVFRDILLDRYENKKHLICTSNYTKQELLRMLKGVFGDYVLSRVESSSVFIQFNTKDFRKVAPDGTAKV